MRPADRQTAEGVLFTDQYQFTLAQLYYRYGLHEKRVQFDHFFRRYPDYGGGSQAGYCINAGRDWQPDWVADAHFREKDIDFLRGQTGRTGSRVLGDDFLDWLRRNGTFKGIAVQAIPEGRAVHPNVPLTVVQAPLAMAQILETRLLNALNYQILIATKAARVRERARGRLADVGRLDSGVRRLLNPHVYHVSLTQRLWDLKQELIASAMDRSC